MRDFEADLKAAIGDKILDDEIAKEVWCALANVDWYHPEEKQDYSCSWRYAGGLIAEFRGSGCYLDWYCCGQDGVVSEFVRRSMRKLGWIFDNTREVCDEPGCLKDAGCGWNDGTKSRYTCGEHMGKHMTKKSVAL